MEEEVEQLHLEEAAALRLEPSLLDHEWAVEASLAAEVCQECQGCKLCKTSRLVTSKLKL